MSIFVHDQVEYEVAGNGLALMSRFINPKDSLTIPSETMTYDGKYKIIGFSHSMKMQTNSFSSIKFDETSEMHAIPSSFIYSITSSIQLPKDLKRVIGGCCSSNFWPHICINSSNKYVSVISSHNIINNFPLEIMKQNFKRSFLRIRETVSIIGKSAYLNNKSIVTVFIPVSVEIIDGFAFSNCSNLEFVFFLKNSKLRKIGQNAFQKTSIYQVWILNKVDEIEDKAFSECHNLHSIFFCENSKLKRIGESAFENASVKYADFPSSVEVIDDFAFSMCSRLEEITFPEDSRLKHIGANAFCELEISSIKIPESVVTIGSYAFSCTNIKSIDLPASIEEIGEALYENCENIRNFQFDWNSNLRIIGHHNFCEMLVKSIEFPATVEEIGNYSFARCKNLSTISFPKNSKLKKIGYYTFTESIIKSITFPATIEVIEEYAFMNCKKLVSVNFIKKSKTLIIRNNAFNGCKSLKKKLI